MPSPATLASFAVASVILILLPGPAMLFLVARGVAGGPRAGALSALGIESATAVYVAATALGLTAVLAASTTAFTVARYAGAAYLVVLGIRTLRDRGRSSPEVVTPTSASGWSMWRQGFLVGIGNPKVALFFLAFFPQFLHPEAGPVASQVLVLGAVTIAIGSVLDVATACSVAWCAAVSPGDRALRAGVGSPWASPISAWAGSRRSPASGPPDERTDHHNSG